MSTLDTSGCILLWMAIGTISLNYWRTLSIHKSLRMIRLRDLPPNQLTYLLNAIILP
jgi:hypothetical protein